MNFARQRPWANAFSMDAPCAQILDRRRDSVRGQTPELAGANLVPNITTTLKLSNERAKRRRRGTTH